MSRAGLLVASILAFVLCGTSSAAPANRVITQPLDVQADELIIGTDVLGNITIRFNRIGTEKFIRWIEGTGLQLDYGNGSELTFIDGALITDRNSDPSAFVLSRANTLRASFRLSDTTAEDWFIGDGVAGTRWIYGDATQGNVRISTETDEQLPAAKLDVRGSDTTLPTLLIRCADSQSDNCIEVRNSDNSNRTVFDKFGLLASAELDGSGGTCTSPDRSACWKEPMILRSYNSEDPAEFESPTEPAFVLQQMNTGIEATGNLVEYRVNVSPTTAEGESGTLSAYMTQGGSQYRDVGGTAYLVADELSDPNWIGTHEFQSPGAVQFEIAPEFETYTVMHETTEPSNPVANTMRRFVLEDASGLPQMFLKDANGNNTQLGCRTTTGDPYAVTPTSYGCLIYNRAGDGDCKYNALYDDSPGVQAFEWVPVIGTGITGCPVE